MVLLEAPSAHGYAQGLRALSAEGDALEPALVDLLPVYEGAQDLLRAELGLARRMPPDALAVFAAGSFQDPQGERYHLARRWLPGVDVEALLAGLEGVPGALAVEAAAHLGRAFLRALERVPLQCHALPSDLVVGWDGRVACRAPTFALERHHDFGPLRWMAPEAIQGQALTQAARAHAAAGLVFVLLTRRHFVTPAGAGTMDMLLALLKDAPTPLRALRPELPTELARSVDAALAREPRERPEPSALDNALARYDSAGARPMLAGLLAALFPQAREEDLAWWEEARCLDLDQAPRASVASERAEGNLDLVLKRIQDRNMTLT